MEMILMKSSSNERIQFSIRTMLLLMVALAVVLCVINQWRMRRFAERQLGIIGTRFNPDSNGFSHFSGMKDEEESRDLTPLRAIRIAQDFSEAKNLLIYARNLEVLELRDMNLDASELAEVLSSLPNLRCLQLKECNIVSNKSVQIYSSSLRELAICECNGSSEAIENFSFVAPKLTELDLTRSHIRSLSCFSECMKLHRICLLNAVVIDEIGPTIADLKCLKVLCPDGSGMSHESIDNLKRKLPSLQIWGTDK